MMVIHAPISVQSACSQRPYFLVLLPVLMSIAAPTPYAMGAMMQS